MHSEHGGIIAAGLLKTVVGLLLAALVVLEIGAVAANHYQVDNVGAEAIRTALSALRAHGSERAVRTAVETELTQHHGASLQYLDVRDDRVTITVSRQANVLFLDRVGALQSVLQAQVRKSASGLQ